MCWQDPGARATRFDHWAASPIPGALETKLADGGVLTMASAAALTAGLLTIPVYEIYKVGEEPRWLDGLDLLGTATGLRAAVVPHYDNAEGGNHDTRFCYIGERRLRVLERSMPEDAFLLGVDSHTAIVIDLEDGSASVFGLGGVTVRVAGRSAFLPSGTTITLASLAETAESLAHGTAPMVDADRTTSAAAPTGADDSPDGMGGSLRDEVARLDGAFSRRSR